MNCATYARKSTEQRVAAEAKSITRQAENARKFAVERGWTVTAEFSDDAISGAEFERRPGLQAMIAAAERREFSVLVVSELKTLGREQLETPYLVKRLALAGVMIWTYMDGRCRTPKNQAEKLGLAIDAYSDEAYRTGTAERMKEGHAKHVDLGHVVGGRLYGYKNTHVYQGVDSQGNPVRTHVVREKHPEEEAVVVRIFELYAAGSGLKMIARALTRDHVAPPRYTPHEGLTALGAWAPSTVRAVLDREEYRGVTLWNRSRKRDDWGQKNVTPRPSAEHKRRDRPDLRVVTDELWARVRARRADVEARAVRFAGGRLAGRPKRGGERNLLAGLGTCGSCGGGLEVARGAYACARRRRVGEAACGNTMRLDVAVTDEQVLRAVEEHVLTAERVEAFLLSVEEAAADGRRPGLEKELRDVTRRLAHLADAIEAGGDAATLVERMRALEERKRALGEDLRAARPVPRLAPAVVESRLAEWRRVLRGSVTQARTVLQRVVDGRVTFSPYPGRMGASFEAPTRFSALFAGIVVADVALPSFVERGDRRGRESLDREQRTIEADYEELLRRAESKGVRPWRDSNPRSPP